MLGRTNLIKFPWLQAARAMGAQCGRTLLLVLALMLFQARIAACCITCGVECSNLKILAWHRKLLPWKSIEIPHIPRQPWRLPGRHLSEKFELKTCKGSNMFQHFLLALALILCAGVCDGPKAANRCAGVGHLPFCSVGVVSLSDSDGVVTATWTSTWTALAAALLYCWNQGVDNAHGRSCSSEHRDLAVEKPSVALQFWLLRFRSHCDLMAIGYNIGITSESLRNSQLPNFQRGTCPNIQSQDGWVALISCELMGG